MLLECSWQVSGSKKDFKYTEPLDSDTEQGCVVKPK